MTEKIEVVHGTDARATRKRETDRAELEERAQYGSWPRGSLGEDIVEDFGPCSRLDRAA